MKTMIIISAAWLAWAALALAQSEMPKPAPEHKKLDIFVGSWTLAGDMKPSSFGPGGKMSETQKCDWMDGDFFLLCHTDFKSSMGDGSGLSILGYSTDDKSYTYREYNSWGESMESKGSSNPDTWTWTSDEKVAGKMMKSRFTMKFTSPTAYTFTYEMSDDGAKWSLLMDGQAARDK